MMSVPRIALAAAIAASTAACDKEKQATPAASAPQPAAKPDTDGRMTLEQALARRRSVRDFLDRPVIETQLAQLAWAAQGITEPVRGYRTAPSAGALYPIELYVVTPEAVLHYLPARHAFEISVRGDKRQALAGAALHQTWVARASATFVVTAVYERTRSKYGQRGVRYAIIEVGHVCQNISLQAVALGLGSVSVGAFQDEEVRRLIGAPPDHRPLCLVCVGHPRVPPQ